MCSIGIDRLDIAHSYSVKIKGRAIVQNTMLNWEKIQNLLDLFFQTLISYSSYMDNESALWHSMPYIDPEYPIKKFEYAVDKFTSYYSESKYSSWSLPSVSLSSFSF